MNLSFSAHKNSNYQKFKYFISCAFVILIQWSNLNSKKAKQVNGSSEFKGSDLDV